jgi:hypothetical protein
MGARAVPCSRSSTGHVAATFRLIRSYNYTQLSLPGCNPIVEPIRGTTLRKEAQTQGTVCRCTLDTHFFVVGWTSISMHARTQQHALQSRNRPAGCHHSLGWPRCEAWVPMLGVIIIVHVCRHTAADTEDTSSRLVKGGWWPAVREDKLKLDVR